MRIAVCDDDEQEISRIGKLLKKYENSRGEAFDCRYITNSTDFLCEFKGGEYDLVLLDVRMPGAGWIQAAQEMRKRDGNVRLIFVSSSPEFAVESYRVGAYYYLLKPVDGEVLFPLLDRMGRELSAQAEESFVLRNRDGIVRIAYAALAYVEVMNKTLFFHLTDGMVRETTAALTDFEGKLLARPEFLKAHRSYLVNADYIQAMDAQGIRMKDGHSIPVSRNRRSQVQDAYMRFLHRAGERAPAFEADGRTRQEGPWRILLVDDDPADRMIWGDILKRHGCVVLQAGNGEDALRLAADGPWDCVLLDVMIPGGDGFSICERLQRFMDTPVIFLSSLTESEKQVEGFAAGGIDYITKDTPSELFWAKVETRIRLAMSERTQLRYGPLLLDLTGRRVWMEEQELSLAPVEFDLLCCLAEHSGCVFAPEEIYGIIWGSQPWDGGKLVQTHMSRLRRKLEKAWEGHRFIETVWGRGYRFVPAKQ